MIEGFIGKKFGAVTVISQIGHGSRWNCVCECGKSVTAVGSYLLRIKSCGCLRMRTFKHGEGSRSNPTAEFKCWSGMIKRCSYPRDKNYHLYGGRGITVCDEWKNDYLAFLSYVGRKPTPKHTIDRFPNSDGNYEPGNVRWATSKEQSRNRRGLTIVEFNGIKMPLVEAVEKSNQNYGRVIARLALGWSLDRSLRTPGRTHTKRSSKWLAI